MTGRKRKSSLGKTPEAKELTANMAKLDRMQAKLAKKSNNVSEQLEEYKNELESLLD